MFGPFLIKQHRKEMNRYAIILTCLSSRAVHLELVYTMETDSFISIPDGIDRSFWKYTSHKMSQWYQFYWSPIGNTKDIFRNGHDYTEK